MTLDEEKNLKEAGLLFGPENQNSFKIVPPKAMSPPSIVISLANKAEESYDSLIRPRTQKTEHRTLRRVRSDKAGIAFAIKSKSKLFQYLFVNLFLQKCMKYALNLTVMITKN